jgi:hypothetical protein
MHRSGTSMLSRILRSQGLFLGHRTQGDDEALFFLRLNRWMLHMAGTEWDHPRPALEMLEDHENIERLLVYLRRRMSGPRTFTFLGPRIVEARARLSPTLPFEWGFKDPRSSLFLPVWLRLFPQARLLRIRRHGLDVAASLRTRHHAIRSELGGRYQRAVHLGLAAPVRARVVDAVRCATIEGALGIWSEYETALDRALASVPDDQQMTIKYEDYLDDPAGHHKQIGAFLGRSVERPIPSGIRPDPSRSFAHRRDPDLVAKASELATLLASHGY